MRGKCPEVRQRRGPLPLCSCSILRSDCLFNLLPDEGQALAQRLGCKFVESSAKTCVNVEKAYYTVVSARSRGSVSFAMTHDLFLVQVRMIREQREGSTGPTQKKKKSKCNIL
jgi:GTPase KRas protein